MKTLCLILTTILSIFIFGDLIGQNSTLLSSNSEIAPDIERSELGKWFYFKEDISYDKGALFSTDKNKLGLNANDEMEIFNERETPQGMVVTKYQQYFQSIKVENAVTHEYYQYCRVKYIKGNIVENLNESATPSISFSSALQFALESINATEYAWENESWESALKEELNNQSATLYPTEILEWTQVESGNFSESNYKLSYKISIITTVPHNNLTVYVDANTGDVLKSTSQLVNNGTADVLFEGNRAIDIEWRGGVYTDWILKALDNGKDITTKILEDQNSSWFWSPQVDNEDEDWGLSEQRSTTTHRGVTASWDYFETRHDWFGMDDQGARIRVETESNAKGQFDPNPSSLGNFRYTLRFGNAIENRDESYAGVVDVTGHEFTHGIVFNAAGEQSATFGESGALNESISDIFGVLIESFASGNPVDWIIGDQIDEGTVTRLYQRSLIDPASLELPFLDLPGTINDRVQSGLPDTYEGPRWYEGTGDNNGVHINNGVHNFWFYLLVNGGNHNSIDVDGIGLIDAEDLLFLNLITNFDINTNYENIREGYINTAREIWGICSSQEESIVNAWAACGLGEPFDFCVGIRGKNVICVDLGQLPTSFTASNAPGTTFTWTYPSSWVATESGVDNEILTLNSVLQNDLPQEAFVTINSSNGSTAIKRVFVRNCQLTEDPECIKIIHRQAKPHTEIILTMFPNPVLDNLNIRIATELQSPINYQIFNLTGKIVLTGVLYQENVNINSSIFNPGIYIIRFNSEEGSIVKSFVKI